MLYSLFFFVFFFKQKTAYEMRISDWSSDVCSSDLGWRQFTRRAIPLSGERPMPDDVKIKLPDYEKSGVNMCPGHGTRGRKACNAALKQLAGNGDPGMLGRLSAHLPQLDVRSGERCAGKQGVGSCRSRCGAS